MMRSKTAALLVAAFACGAVAGAGLAVWYLDSGTVAAPVTSTAPHAVEPAAGPSPTRRRDDLEELLELLRAERTDAALDRLEAVERRASPEAYLAARAAVLDELATWVERGRLEPALRLAVEYRRRYVHDAAATTLLAEIYERLGRPEDAVSALFEVLAYPPSAEVAQQTRRRIDALERAHAAGLAQRREYHALVAFYATLLDLDPSNDHYRLAQAQWLAEIEAYDRAEALLREVGGDRADEVAALRARLEYGQAGIPVERQGDRLIAEAWVSNRPVRLLIDTGATMTSLSPALLRRLGARRETASARVVTASGTITAPVFTVAELVVGEQTFTNHRLLGLDLDDAGVDGLLGMDVLGSTGLPAMNPGGPAPR